MMTMQLNGMTWRSMALLLAVSGLTACADEVPQALGTLEYDRVTLPAPAAERIDAVAVREGQQVRAGEVLLTLERIRTAAQTDAAQARYDEAASQYRAKVRQAVSEVEQALVRLQSTAERSASARTAADGYRASFDATEARWRGGLASLVELEDARRTALAAENALIALQHERQTAWIALYRAAGGGWKL